MLKELFYPLTDTVSFFRIFKYPTFRSAYAAVTALLIKGLKKLKAGSVIIQVLCYKITKKRVFRMAPLHHHFELKGWDESKVVMRFRILGGLFTILSLSTLKLQKL